MQFVRSASLLTCCVSGFAFAGVANAEATSTAESTDAQTSSSAASNEDNSTTQPSEGGLQEIIVTAQRRVENIQKTPISITALSGDDLIKEGVQDASSLQRFVPNVQVNQSGGTASIAIRGIVSTNNTEVGDPALAFNLDGVYLGRPQQAGALFYDVERIEVLRGPQGTLYGRNATTGALNIITKKPTDELTAEGTFEVGSYQLYRAQAAFNLPVNDWLKVRVATNGYSQGSTLKTPPWPDYGKTNSVAGRIHVLIEPTLNLSILLSGDYSKTSGTPQTSIQLPLSDTPRVITGISQPGSIDQTDFGGSATVNWDIGLGTITYIGSYREQETHTLSGYTSPIAAEADSNPRQLSNELRFTYDDDHLNLVAGLFAYSEKNAWMVYIPPAVAFLMPDVDSKSKAVFGQATYSPIYNLHLTAGLRYTEDHKSRNGGNYAYDSSKPCTYFECLQGYDNLVLLYENFADYKWNKLNYRFGVDFDLSPDNLLYASLTTGYKAGGYFDGVPPNNFYNPENVRSIEVGTKNRFLDNRLQINLSLFHYRYTDFQVSFVDQATRVTHTLNAQVAINYGAELETDFQITPNDNLSLAVAYLHADYDEFVLPAPDQFGRQDYSGNRLQQAPRLGVNLGYSHSFDLSNDARLSVSGYTHFQSSSELGYQNLPITHQGSYTRSDLRLTYSAPSRAWDFTVYVRNIEDKKVLTGASANNAPNEDTGSGTLAMPRTFGAVLSVKM